ncbi:purple acid phosphatase 3 [Selaginella moellendorffii]|uniref:purple acid phosphatase 3 n=1 Tax=Selaginella moellendorffii TaxID=88036 RepID=UPI000D1C451A|nr:purple acid phosphatase 3 [Selaginella moellendorffii]|eukprot:XP_024529679.1 purple acid phosphatase 3 [Selaginella moellendorffii]
MGAGDDYRHASDEEEALIVSKTREELRANDSRRFWIVVSLLLLVSVLGLGLLYSRAGGGIITRQEEFPLNFLVIGDWGRNGFYNQSLVASQMGRVGELLDIDFVISVGDNFYNTGLTGVKDPKFTTSFSRIYTAPSLQKPWYTRACESSVDLFFIDTTPFIDEYWMPNATQTFDWRGLAPRQEQLRSQVERLDRLLASSRATWKIVVGHHTMHSFGHHGDSVELLDQILPVLEAHDVDAYINGHDHCLEHIKHSDRYAYDLSIPADHSCSVWLVFAARSPSSPVARAPNPGKESAPPQLRTACTSPTMAKASSRLPWGAARFS